jgi:peroxiredoxin
MRAMLKRLFVLGLFAGTQAWAAQQPVPIPPALLPALEWMKLQTDKVVAIHYLNEAGEPVDEPAFVDQFGRMLGFTMKRGRYPDGSLDVTLRLRPGIQAQTFPRLKVGSPIPAFQLARLDGTPVDDKALAGKTTVVTFFHARCEACADMIPMLNALAERRKDLQFLAFSLDGAAETRAFVTNKGLRWPVVADAGKLADAIGARIPAIVLFDRRGRLASLMAGAVPQENADAFNAWLDRKAGAAQAASEAAVYVPPGTTIADVAECGPMLYPGSEEPLGHTANIRMYVLLSPEGRVKDYRLADASGYPKLDQAMVKHFVTCRFKPVMANGAAIESWATFQLNWSWSTR